MVFVLAWSLALQTAALRCGLVGLHAFPSHVPRAAWPAPAFVVAALFGWLVAQPADTRWWLGLLAGVPVGALLAVAMAALVRRSPDGRWLSAERRSRTTPACDAHPLPLDGHPHAGALLLSPTDCFPEATVVIVLHGGGNDRFFGLSYLFEQLLARGHRVMTAHLPGHGREGSEPFTLESCRRRADALVALAQRRFPRARVVLLGQSLGGALALDRLARGRGCDGVIAVATPAKLQLGSRLWRELAALVRTAIYRALAYGNVAEALPAAGSFKRTAYPVRVESHPSYVQAFASAIETMDLPRRLQSVRDGVPPVLLIHGARDGVVPPTDTRRLAAALGDRAEARVFDRVTHLDPLLDGEVVAQLVDWIERRRS